MTNGLGNHLHGFGNKATRTSRSVRSSCHQPPKEKRTIFQRRGSTHVLPSAQFNVTIETDAEFLEQRKEAPRRVEPAIGRRREHIDDNALNMRFRARP